MADHSLTPSEQLAVLHRKAAALFAEHDFSVATTGAIHGAALPGVVALIAADVARLLMANTEASRDLAIELIDFLDRLEVEAAAGRSSPGRTHVSKGEA